MGLSSINFIFTERVLIFTLKNCVMRCDILTARAFTVFALSLRHLVVRAFLRSSEGAALLSLLFRLSGDSPTCP